VAWFVSADMVINNRMDCWLRGSNERMIDFDQIQIQNDDSFCEGMPLICGDMSELTRLAPR
jgi:hypothetical protein